MAHKPAASHRNARSRQTAPAGAGRAKTSPPALTNGPYPRSARVADDILTAMGAAPPVDDAAMLPGGNIVRLSEIAPDPMHWLSPGLLAVGEITVLDGDPGLGKTLQDEAAAHGHAVPARARRAESIVIRKQPGPNGHWTWELPAPRDAIHPEHG